jgi:hypothetical protein
VATPEHPTGRLHEVELTAVVPTQASIGRRVKLGLTDRRLGVLGMILGVGLGAAALGLAVDGWRGALVAGVGSVIALAAVLRTGRLGQQAMRLARWLAPE